MMNKDKLKQFVNALDTLSDDVKDWGVNMGSGKKPMCDTPGCHAGLISIVAKDLPELQEIYKPLYFLGCAPASGSENQYIFHVWSRALAVFLGFVDIRDLRDWAKDNPKLWGNRSGYNMFCSFFAFTYDLNKEITHRVIINHWKQVLKNIEDEGA
jgi:hypothetical protein